MLSRRGLEPLKILVDDQDLVMLAETAQIIEDSVDPTWMDPGRRAIYAECASDPDLGDDDRRMAAWDLELHDDPDARRWLLDELDPKTREGLEIGLDKSARPFTLEVDLGPFRCSNCGETLCGRHARVIDRCELLDAIVSEGELRYCRGCLEGLVAVLGDP